MSRSALLYLAVFIAAIAAHAVAVEWDEAADHRTLTTAQRE